MSQVHLVPTTMTVTARGVVWLILKEVMRLHGIPESLCLIEILHSLPYSGRNYID